MDLMAISGDAEEATQYQSMDHIALAMNAAKRIAKKQKKKIKSATRSVRKIHRRLKEWQALELVARTGTDIGKEISYQCRKLYRMCQNNSKLHHEVMEHRFVRYCIDWLFESPNDPDMQSWVPHFIDKLVRMYPKTAAHHRASALRHHIFTAMAAGMKACGDSPEVQHMCAEVVVGLSSVPDHVMRDGDPHHAVSAEDAHGDLADYGITVASDGVGVDAVHLRRGDNHARSLAGKHHLLEALFLACARHKMDDDVQSKCLHAIGHLCYDHKRNRDIAERIHAVRTIADSISSHEKKVQVQVSGLYALAMICHHSELMQRAALEREMPTPADYEREKKRLMRKTKMKGGAGRSAGADDNEEDIILMGGVITLPPGRYIVLGAVVGAMCGHPMDRDVQRWGIVALNNIAGADGQHQCDVIEVEGHVAIRLAMQAHLADEEVQRLAMHALGTLARLNEDTQRAILMSGACLCIVKGMAKHNASAQLQVEGAAAIGALGSLGDENQRAIVEGHAGDQIIKAARGHPEDADVAEEVLRAIGNISRGNAWTAQYMAAAGAVDVITGAMARLGEAHAGVDMAGAWAIGHMCVHAMGNSSLRDAHTDKVVVLQHGVTLSSLVLAMRRRTEDAKMQAACIFAIAQLARRNHYHQSEFEMSGAVAAMRHARHAHSSNAEIESWARSALNLLRLDPDDAQHRVEYHGQRRKPLDVSAVTLPNLASYARRPAEYVIPVRKEEKESPED